MQSNTTPKLLTVVLVRILHLYPAAAFILNTCAEVLTFLKIPEVFFFLFKTAITFSSL